MHNYTIWYDGSCEPINPGGTAAWGVVVRDKNNDLVGTHNGVIGRGEGMSNNVAEFAAATKALRIILGLGLTNNGCSVLMQGDSLMSVNILNGKWKAKKGLYLPYYEQAGIKVEIRWIPREQNEEADALSNSWK